MKNAEFGNNEPKFLRKKVSSMIQKINNTFLSLKKVNNTILKNFNKFQQNWRIFSQKFRKMWLKSTEFTLFSR